MKKKVNIFSDGSCIKNPGPGGYGAILYYNNYKKTISRGYYFTTNNRMELLSIISAIEILKTSCNITIYTDSTYVYFGITNWIKQWKKKNWKNKKKSYIKNVDLWKRLDELISLHHVKWNIIKGHSGNINNELCDKFAKLAANNPSYVDFFYQNHIHKCK